MWRQFVDNIEKKIVLSARTYSILLSDLLQTFIDINTQYNKSSQLKNWYALPGDNSPPKYEFEIL